jgi:hypothetical protein
MKKTVRLPFQQPRKKLPWNDGPKLLGFWAWCFDGNLFIFPDLTINLGTGKSFGD